MKELILAQFRESANLKLRFVKENASLIAKSVQLIVNAYKNGGKVLICGNGGSAGDAQHIAAELVNKFKMEREPLAALALTTDTSAITAIANDYGYSYIFSKQIEALGSDKDVLIILTTSDVSFKKGEHSSNLGFAIKAARRKKMKIIGLLGQKSKKAKKAVDIPLLVPSLETPRIQEAHMTIAHVICDLVEQRFFK